MNGTAERDETKGRGSEDPWPGVIAVVFFLLFAAIIIAAIYRYDTAAEAMAVFGGLWGAFGAGIGLLFAYFFTRGPITEAKVMATKAMDKASDASSKADVVEAKMEARHSPTT